VTADKVERRQRTTFREKLGFLIFLCNTNTPSIKRYINITPQSANKAKPRLINNLFH
jgi:hypothetical protein